MDCKTPSEAALLPPSPIEPSTVEAYREELILNLTSARELAAKSLQVSQARSKERHDRSVRVRKYQKGDWVLVKFPSEETGRNRKLSQPWHGPYRVISINEPDITVQKVYPTRPGQIQIHQSRVTPCPDDLPPGYYWYGRKHCCPGNPPHWVEHLAQQDQAPLPGSTRSVDPASDNSSTSLPEQIPDDPGAHIPSDITGSTGTESTVADHAGTDVETDCPQPVLSCGSNLQGRSQNGTNGYPRTDAAPNSCKSAQDPLDWSVLTGPNSVEGVQHTDQANTQYREQPSAQHQDRSNLQVSCPGNGDGRGNQYESHKQSQRPSAGYRRSSRYSLRKHVGPPQRWSKLGASFS